MAEPNWTDVVGAISSAVVPVIVILAGVSIGRRQSRNDELIKVRLDYYKSLAPDLNRLMCYMTFIGSWRDDSPAAVIELKRKLDASFFCAAPLFSDGASSAYRQLMDLSFDTFGLWGSDARIKSSAFRRRQSWRGQQPWLAEWDSCFVIRDEEAIPAKDLKEYRDAYDHMLATLVKDIDISRARPRYTTDEVSLNAHAPRPRDID